MYCWRKASQASSFSLQCSGFKPLASGFKRQSESFKLQAFQASSPSAFKRPRASSFNNISMGIKIDTSTSTAIVVPCTSTVFKLRSSSFERTFTFKLQASGRMLQASGLQLQAELQAVSFKLAKLLILVLLLICTFILIMWWTCQAWSFRLQAASFSNFKSQASSFKLQASMLKLQASSFRCQAASFSSFKSQASAFLKLPASSLNNNNTITWINIDTSTSTAIVLPCTSAVLKPQASFTFKLQALGCRLRLMFSLQDSSLKFEASSFKLRLRASGCKLRAYSSKLPVSSF